MAFAEDFDIFFNTAEFAVQATWSESADPVNVIFDKAFIEAQGIVGNNPIALGKESDFPGVEEGQELTINSVLYEITTPEPDGTGLVILQLEQR
jgi:hypothetical protein